MAPVLTRSRPPAASRDGGGVLGSLIAVALTAALFALATAALRGPTFVDRVAVANAHPYCVGVDVGRDDGSWLGLTTAGPGGETAVEKVADRGDRWTFRFSAGGVDGGEVRLDRAELEAADWKVAVPDLAGERFRAAGLGPCPRRGLGP